VLRKELKLLRPREEERNVLNEAIARANAEQGYNHFLFAGLYALQLQPAAMVEVERAPERLEHAEGMKRSLLASKQAPSDQEYNVLALLKDAIQQLRAAEAYMPDASALPERLDSAYIEIKDISEEIANLESAVIVDEQRLDHVNTRLSAIY